nr:hypothetical protein [Candidatus Bathyarchaeota archaeon]
MDLDRDYPLPVRGKLEASSYIPDGRPNFTCTKTGLREVIRLLEENGIKASFFVEAVTLQHLQLQEEESIRPIAENEVGCHGLNHEDLTGKHTGLQLTPTQQLESIKKATEIIARITGVKPLGFRAPYLSINRSIERILADLNYMYDSSKYLEVFKPPHPYFLGCKLIEVPLPLYPIGKRKATLYTWTLLEGKRTLEEYKNILTTYIENDDGGILMVSTHTWHLAYNISKCKKLPPKQVRENIYKIHDLLAYLESKGARITPIAEYLKQKGFSKG